MEKGGEISASEIKEIFMLFDKNEDHYVHTLELGTLLRTLAPMVPASVSDPEPVIEGIARKLTGRCLDARTTFKSRLLPL